MAKTKKIPTTIKQFDGRTVEAILKECRDALAPIAEKYGLTLDRKGRTYHRDSLPVMFQFLVKELDEDGNALTAAAKDFQTYAPLYGLKADDLGKEFTSRGETFRISGFAPKSRKYPILGENVRTGKTYKFPLETVKAGLKRAA
jgi:hypothetical protein